MSLIKLAISTANREHLVVFNGSVPALPTLFQSNTQDFEITVVDPPADFSSASSKVDLGTSGLRVSIGETPTGTAGGPTPLALQTTWTWDPTNKHFTGSLALNTAGIDSFLGTLASKPAYFEVNLTTGGNRITLLQIGVTIKAVVDELSGTVPTPTDQYLTKAEMIAMFLKFINDAGHTVVFKSPNAVYGRELGVNDDGSAKDDIITL